MIERTRRSAVLCISGLMVTALVAACGSSGDEPQVARTGALVLLDQEIADSELMDAARREGTLTLYTALSELNARAIAEEFTSVTGIDVNVLYVPGTSLYQRIMSEHGAGQLTADVIQQTDFTLALNEKEAGVFTPYCAPTLKDIPEEYKQEDCSFWSPEVGVEVIFYNRQAVNKDDLPTSWLDLLDPKWKGEIAMASSGAASSYGVPYFFRKNFGLSYWERLAEQDLVFVDNGGLVADTVARGEALLGIQVPALAVVLKDDTGHGPVGLAVPTDGVYAFGYWVGLSSSAPHPNAAKVYLSWLASKAGQEKIAEADGNWPVVPGVSGPTLNGEALPPISEVKAQPSETTDDFAKNKEAWTAEWQNLMGI